MEDNVTKDVSNALSNEQRLVQAQLISANNELYLDESILVLNDTQEYSIHEEVAGPSFGGSTQDAMPTEWTEYMDTEVTEMLENSVINYIPLDLANEQRLSRTQVITNIKVDLDESVLLLDSTQEYSTQGGPSGLSFGETLDITEAVKYMDAEVTEILDNSLNSMTSVEEVTVYQVTEYRP